MLLHIFSIGLIALFLYTFFLVDNFYKKCALIAEIEYKRGQVLANKFMRLGVKISRLRALTGLDLAEFNRCMHQLDELSAEYEKLTVESEKYVSKTADGCSVTNKS